MSRQHSQMHSALCPISLQQSAQILPLFGRLHQQLVARSVLVGNTRGAIWVDDPSRPNLAVLWDRAHHLYVAAQDIPSSAVAAMRQFLRDVIVPHAAAHQMDHYMISPSSVQADALLKVALPNASCRERILLTLTHTGSPKTESGFPDSSLHPLPINAALLQRGLGHTEDLRREIQNMWDSQDLFLQQGFGYCIVADREIVCWCTAEYVGPGWCGIGIETLQPYQQRGLATATATAFVQHCAAHNIIPHWDCWSSNVASLRVARKVGFDSIERYQVFIARFNDLQERSQANEGDTTSI